MPNILNTFFLFVCAPEKILASRPLFSAPHMYYNQCFSACKTLQRLISSNGDHSICNIQICQVVFKKYDNDQRKLVLWCAGGNYEWDAPRENKCSHTHTHTHTHTKSFRKTLTFTESTITPHLHPLVLLSLPQSHPRKINANSVFPYLLTVHLRARYHSRVEGSKEKADSFRLSAALMSSSHCPTRIIPHLISLYSNQPYLSLVHCSFHLSRVLHPSCFLFVHFIAALADKGGLLWPETSCHTKQCCGETL